MSTPVDTMVDEDLCQDEFMCEGCFQSIPTYILRLSEHLPCREKPFRMSSANNIVEPPRANAYIGIAGHGIIILDLYKCFYFVYYMHKNSSFPMKHCARMEEGEGFVHDGEVMRSAGFLDISGL